jgi:accessory gene regulator B
MRSLIEVIADRIAVKLKKANPEETASIEVMRYALIGIFHNASTFAAALVVGALLGQFIETFTVAFCFLMFRFVSGGFHFRTPLACFVFSFITFVSIPFIPIQSELIYVLNTISLLLSFIFAPSNIKDHIRISEKYFPLFKLISVFIIIVSFFIVNPIITLALFVQSVTLINYKRKEVKNE